MSMSPNARRARRLAPVALVATLVVILLVAFSGGDERTYRLVFDNASQIVKGGAVRIGGVQVGTVQSIDLTNRDLAQVRISIADQYAPLRQGSTATIRVSGLGSVAGRYVDVSPAPSFRKPLGEDAVIPVDKTTSVVEVDQIFNTLDKPTRKGLQKAVQGLAASLDGRSAEANAATRQFPGALIALRSVAQDINAQSAEFSALVNNAGRALDALGREPERLTSAISGAHTTMAALGSETGQLRTLLADLPPALGAGSESLKELRDALPDLRRFTDSADLSSRDLAPFLRRLRPVLERAVPVTQRLRQTFATAGPGNDLLDALRDLPPLAASTHRAAPAGREGLKQSTPLLSFIRPYAPDLVAWLRSFGSAGATYDARGHYVRSLPMTDAFRLVEDADGGALLPKPPSERGNSDAITHGNLKRCPGTAGSPPADGSTPFLDSGPLANTDCDPAQRVGGGG